MTVTISVSFVVLGFFLTAKLLQLPERKILVGLIAGITMLRVSLRDERGSTGACAGIT